MLDGCNADRAPSSVLSVGEGGQGIEKEAAGALGVVADGAGFGAQRIVLFDQVRVERIVPKRASDGTMVSDHVGVVGSILIAVS